MTCAENALPLNDFASPKRKDCRLDMNDANGINVELVKVATNGSNGKRNQRNGKRHMQPITDFFHANGGMSDAVKNELNECKDFSVNTNEFPALPDAKTASTTNGNHFNGHKIDEKYDAPNSPSHRNDEASMIFASPAPKLLNGDTKSNQTTPHRIVAISPTKKQRLYEQNTMAVFSNLNIGSNASSPQMKVKTPKKRPNQRTRRKLMVNGPEHLVQTVITLDNQNNQIDKAEAVNGIKEKKEEVEFKAPIVAPKHVHKTQMTDFFPIRRSVRKTKKAVEQENEQSIQLAIEKQLEDGLIVKSFAEKGRGIIAGKPFKRGEFVVEYIGDLIEQSEADRREEEYAKDANFGCYMYYFKHKEQQWW